MRSPAPALPRPGSRGRWAAALLLTAAAVLALAAGARALGEARARLFLPTGEAAWIWARLPRDDSTPVAFYAVKDFTLDAVPAGARLLALADEEYVLYLNGRRVGSGVYAPGALLDVYEVGPLLRAGGNRLLVELRSGRGWGGLLARLEDGDGRGMASTGEDWRIFRRHRPGLANGWEVLGPQDGSEPAHVWGRPPAGRWGLPLPGRERPWPADRAIAAGLFGPAQTGPPVAAARRSSARARTAFGWPGNVVGHLALTLAPRDEVAVALLRTEDGVEARSPVLVVPGAREWVDARPRRFHRAEVLGIGGVTAARVLPAPGAAPLPPPPPGVLGMAPPPLRTPVEEKVRRELERVAGVARGEDL